MWELHRVQMRNSQRNILDHLCCFGRGICVLDNRYYLQHKTDLRLNWSHWVIVQVITSEKSSVKESLGRKLCQITPDQPTVTLWNPKNCFYFFLGLCDGNSRRISVICDNSKQTRSSGSEPRQAQNYSFEFANLNPPTTECCPEHVNLL